MYAVFKCGGKQLRAAVGDTFKVEKVQGEVGAQVVFNHVLLVASDESPLVGTPTVDGAHVVAEIVAHGKQKTVLIQKFKRRKNYRRKVGHRQQFTKIRITEVVVP